MNPKPSPQDILDRRQQALANKHSARLHRMTQEALQLQPSPSSLWQSAWLKPTVATAFSLMLVTSIIFLNPANKKTHTLELDSHLPEWVTDTEVPLTLIENLEFYDWLAQQPENQQAKLQKSLTLALNEFYQYRLGKRHASSDLAEGSSGTAFHTRTVQR